MRLLKEATPELSSVDRYWRIQFMLGATAFTMSSSDALIDILENKLGVETTVQEIAARLVPFLAAGMKLQTKCWCRLPLQAFRLPELPPRLG